MGCSQSFVQPVQEETVEFLHGIKTEKQISSLVETEDKRLACTCSKIIIFSYNPIKNKWKRDIEKQHGSEVSGLCAMKGNRLFSCGTILFQVWALSEEDLTLIKEINVHTKAVYQIIPLSNDRFASCSWDKTIKIWKDDGSYECINTLKSDGVVVSILQLKGKEELVSSSEDESYNKEINFWDLNTYTETHTVAGHSPFLPTHMIEIPDGNVAVVSHEENYCIVIIDTSLYEIKKIIYVEYHIPNYSSLCAINDHSFVYTRDGNFVQISCKDYSVVCKSRGENFNGVAGIILVQGGQFLAIENESWISIVKLCKP